MSAPPSVAILPYRARWPRGLARVPLASLLWPFGRPADLAGTVGDLGPADHLIAFPSPALLLLPHPGLRAALTLAFLEPRALHGARMRLAALVHRRFRRILTCDPRLAAAVPNARRFTFGGCWVPGWRELDLAKPRPLSLIASAKRALPGHRLRHRIAARLTEGGIAADLIGGGYRPFAEKHAGLAPYRFSVVIENVREPGYLTEKLIDAILCRTIPIYWGDPEVARVFDPAGMVLCADADAIVAACRDTGPDAYAARLPAALENLARAEPFAAPWRRLADAALAP